VEKIFDIPTVYDEFGNYDSKIIVCPECKRPCNDSYAKNVGLEPMSSFVIGFLLHCVHCHKKSFISMLGGPPIFDLSGRYLFVIGKEG
jgi:hypothetical protein